MKKIIVIVIVFFIGSLIAEELPPIEEMVGQMLMVGFHGTAINESNPIVRDIKDYHLGGVVLFEYNVITEDDDAHDKNRLQKLTADLKKHSSYPLFVAVDMEGGKVARLNKKAGFEDFPSHLRLGTVNDTLFTMQTGAKIGKILKENGINLNFAPVVDLNINPDNPAIGKWGRSFSADPETVYSHSRSFITGMNKSGIISCIKHFPGHGSAFNDSHLGLTDITDTWKNDELTPYNKLIADGLVNMVMTGHLFNSNLDPDYPATLSHTMLTSILRYGLGFKGVIISDDFNMKAINDHYSLEETILLAINAGVDILLYGNNLIYDPDIALKSHKIIMKLLADNSISKDRITESFLRIRALKENIDD